MVLIHGVGQGLRLSCWAQPDLEADEVFGCRAMHVWAVILDAMGLFTSPLIRIGMKTASSFGRADRDSNIPQGDRSTGTPGKVVVPHEGANIAVRCSLWFSSTVRVPCFSSL